VRLLSPVPSCLPANHTVSAEKITRCGMCGIAPTTTILGEPGRAPAGPPLRQAARFFYWLRLSLVLLDCPALAASYQLRFS
jgi:hypothetical protein